MSKKDESEPVSETLGATLLELGLLTADEYQFQRILNSLEFNELAGKLKKNIYRNRKKNFTNSSQ